MNIQSILTDSSSEPIATPYSKQLQRGCRALRFVPELEAEYRVNSKQTVIDQSKIAALIGTAIWLLFIGIDLIRLHPNYGDVFHRLFFLAIMRAFILLGFVVSLVALQRGVSLLYLRWITAGMLWLLTAGAAVAITTYEKLGVRHENSVLSLVVIAIFLPLSLTLWEELILAVVCFGTVLIIGLATPGSDPLIMFMRLPFMLLIASIVGALGAYLREYTQREQFLLRGQLQWYAARDSLTGLFNRRMFTHYLEVSIRQAQREEVELALILVDVDHFKLYNDTYGHQAGDRALQNLGAQLDYCAKRPLDMAARIGGEEMALILYGVTADYANRVCSQLLHSIHNLNIPHSTSPTGDRLSLSIGWHC